MNDPIYLSLAVLARDPEGAATLERALRSVLERPDGPMFDEVVVLLGGDPAERCRDIALRLANEFRGVAWQFLNLPADMPRRDDGGLGDFAAARNYLYSKCRGTWIGYIDADDVVPAPKPAAPDAPSFTMKSFLKTLPEKFNSVVFTYHYAHDVEKNVLVETTREWVRWRDGFSWVNRAPGHHEAIFPIYPNQRNVAALESFVVEHWPADGTTEMRLRRNDALLDASKFLGGPEEWGVRYYLARQAERRGQYDLANKYNDECVALARREDEKYTSLHVRARVLRYLGRHTEALASALLAYYFAPLKGEAISDVVLISLDTGEPAKAAEWYGRLLAAPAEAKKSGAEWNAYETDLWPHVAASRALLALERFDEAVAAAGVAAGFAPYDVGAQRALADAVAARALRTARESARFLVDYAAHRDDAERVRALAEALPYVLEHDGEVAGTVAKADAAAFSEHPPSATAARLMAEARPGLVTRVVQYGTAPEATVAKERVYTPGRLLSEIRRFRHIERLERVPADDSDPRREDVIVAAYDPSSAAGWGEKPEVVFYCPEYTEPWGPFTPERRGIGGSEEMVVLVSRYLARHGASVTVYAPVDDIVVDQDVVWRPFMTFDPEKPCDVLVSHRTGHLARRAKLGAARHYVWLHDAVSTRFAEDYEGPRQARVSGYLTLSKWQEDEYARTYSMAREKMVRVANAPDPEDVPGDGARVAHRAVYASAPYRGLHMLLRIWPLVRERVPDAELQVCGDWVVHDSLARAYPALNSIKADILKNKDAPGVEWIGKLASPKLRRVFQEASIFVYPSTFNETSCRAAVRAMACGAVPIYRPLAALGETIGSHGTAVAGDMAKPEYLRAFADAVADAILHPRTEAERLAMSEDVHARHDPWAAWLEVAGLAKPKARVDEATISAFVKYAATLPKTPNVAYAEDDGL